MGTRRRHLLLALTLVLVGCRSDLEKSGQPYAWVNVRALPYRCITSPVPAEILGKVGDAEAKLYDGEHEWFLGVEHQVVLPAVELSGVSIVTPAAPCAPNAADGATAAVVYRSNGAPKLDRLRTVITFD